MHLINVDSFCLIVGYQIYASKIQIQKVFLLALPLSKRVSSSHFSSLHLSNFIIFFVVFCRLFYPYKHYNQTLQPKIKANYYIVTSFELRKSQVVCDWSRNSSKLRVAVFLTNHISCKFCICGNVVDSLVNDPYLIWPFYCKPLALI